MEEKPMEEAQAEAIAQFLGKQVTENKRTKIAVCLENRTRYLTVLLEDVYQPYNASACLRNCDCLGIQDFHLVENRHLYRPTEGIAMGSFKWLTMHRHQSTEEAIAALRTGGYRIVATVPNPDSYSPLTLPLDRPMVLLFGTEKRGLSPQALAAADDQLCLPMYGFTQSFNVSVAQALVLSRILERLRESEIAWQLSEQEKTTLKLSWYRLLLKRHPMLEAEFLRSLGTAEVSKIVDNCPT